MKKTFRKTLLKDIKKNFSRFLAIIAIVALGVGFLIGLLSATPDLQYSVDQYYDQQNMYDLQIKSTIGFDEEDVISLKEDVPEIEEAIGYYQIDLVGEYQNQDVTVRKIVTDMDSPINRMELVLGRYPQNENEVVVQQKGIFLDTVELDSDIYVDGKTYRIVGVCHNPVYYYKMPEVALAGSGTLDVVCWVDAQYEPLPAITDLVLTIQGADDKNSFKDEYLDLVEQTALKIEQLAPTYLQERYTQLAYQQIYNTAYETLQQQYPFLSEEALKKIMDEQEETFRQKANEVTDQAFEEGNLEWYVLDRTSNVSFVSFKENAKKVNDIAVIFPVFFFFIAALIALTSVTRMVAEDRSNIGTLKSLGYSLGTILFKYIFYSLLAGLLGSLIGIVLGVYILPTVIYNAYNTLFFLPPVLYQWNAVIILLSALAMIVTILLVTVAVCLKTLKERPNALLVAKAPRPGKRILLERMTFIWKHLKFKYKSALRNVFRFKRNLIMMIVGVGGCTALMLVAFGIQDSVANFSHHQYENVLKYDLLIETTEELSFDDVFKDSVYMEFETETATVAQNKDYQLDVYYCNDEILNYMNLEVSSFDQDSVIVSKQLANEFHLKKGSTLTLSVDNQTKSFIISSVFDNYVSNYLIVHQDQKEQYQPNAYLVRYGEQDRANEKEILMQMNQNDRVVTAEAISQTRTNYDSMSDSLGIIVAVVILCSGALAIIVIYNLANININERIKEIATLRVLGYQQTEVCGYIYREILLMSVLGILFGFLLGPILNYFVMDRISSIGQYFKTSLAWPNFFYSLLLTIAFVLLVLVIFIPKIRKIKMVESLKCVD